MFFSLVLIETLWNVNSLTVFVSVIAFIVLIETLWNVNVTASTVERCCRTVLIETLWNVNLKFYKQTEKGKMY